MDIQEYADAINLELDLKYYPNQKGRWIASFSDTEVKGDGVLIGEYGNGASPVYAISDYIEKIAGKTIVVRANGDERREFVVPDSLTALKAIEEQ